MLKGRWEGKELILDKEKKDGANFEILRAIQGIQSANVSYEARRYILYRLNSQIE